MKLSRNRRVWTVTNTIFVPKDARVSARENALSDVWIPTGVKSYVTVDPGGLLGMILLLCPS